MKHYLIIQGGLGNQMFQYAFYRALKNKGLDVVMDISLYKVLRMHNGYELLYDFGITEPTYSRPWFFQKLFNAVEHLIPGTINTYDNWDLYFNFIKSKKFLKGYWQSERYFSSVKEEIIEIFRFHGIDEKNLQIAKDMQSCNSVSIHIRRGDYLDIARYANICTENYYRNAIYYVKQHVSEPKFFFFSNEKKWTQEFAKRLCIDNALIVHNTGADSYKDMFLMTQCKHNILANSSFSWWGAYLNKNEGAIKIAPKGWDNTDTPEINKERIPENYIRL